MYSSFFFIHEKEFSMENVFKILTEAIIMTCKQNSSLIIHCSSGQVVVYDGSGPGLLLYYKAGSLGNDYYQSQDEMERGRREPRKEDVCPGPDNGLSQRAGQHGRVINRISKSISFY